MTGNHLSGTDIHQHRGQTPRDDFIVNCITIRLLVSPRRPQPAPAHRYAESPVGPAEGAGLGAPVAAPAWPASSPTRRVTRGGVVG